jgi:hypothetical protein
VVSITEHQLPHFLCLQYVLTLLRILLKSVVDAKCGLKHEWRYGRVGKIFVIGVNVDLLAIEHILEVF